MTSWFVAVLAWIGTLVGQADLDVECLALGGLDVARAHAFATGDPTSLERVYADEELRAVDERVLDSYVDRGLALHGVGTERLSCRVLRREGRRVQLDVVDRLGVTSVEQDGRRVALPADEPSRRTVVLERTRRGWQVAASR